MSMSTPTNHLLEPPASRPAGASALHDHGVDSRLPRVVVSNGVHRFHLAVAAAELHRRGMLTALLTAGYPTPGWDRLIQWSGLGRVSAVQRLVDRKEAIPADRVSALWAAEGVAQGGRLLAARAGRAALGQATDDWSMGVYARGAAARLARIDADVYHFRAGYGRGSIAQAKRQGMLTLCDHSIAHPAVVQALVAHAGRLPADWRTPDAAAGQTAEDRFWQHQARDIAEADHVLVNSDFVRQTMLRMGSDPARVHVAYLGVDDRFLEHVLPRSPQPLAGPLRILYAGGLIPRKGFDLLVEALQRIGDIPWHLTVAGGGDADVLARHAAFLARPEVSHLGIVDRARLARLMGEHELFVFPSLVEGSARVVFEALAAGCVVITTPNSGSIVEHGVHGLLVEPGSAGAVEKAIRAASADRAGLARTGAANQALVNESFRQLHYGNRLVALYRHLLDRDRCMAPSPAAEESA